MGEALPFRTEADRKRYERNRARRGRGAGAQGQSPIPIGRDLPHSLEAEEFLLSCCLLDGVDVVTRCLQAGIRAGAFYDTKHGLIYDSILRLFGASKPIDVSIVAEELKTAGQLDQVGGYAFLSQVSSRIPTTAQAGYFIEKVREQALLREIIRTAAGVVEDAYGFSGEIDEFAGAVGQRVMAVTGDRTGLPPIMSDAQLRAAELPEPPMLIEGVMHMGRRVLLLAPSKASKTWTSMDISVSVASGKPWLGFKTHQARVLHIDLELPTWDVKKRREKLCELKGIKEVPQGIDWWSLDGYQRSIDELLPLITARAPLGKYGLIVIEPAYVILGDRDENDNADVTNFMNRLAWLARMTGAAVLCTHHFAKGDASKKEAKDRGSGAGAWSRAPDTGIVLTPLDEDQGEDCYRMEFFERSMKRHAPVGVKFEYPLFRVQGGLDLNALREAGRPAKWSSRDVADVLREPMSYSQWERAACAKLRDAKGDKMSESTFKRRMGEAIAAGMVSQCGALYSRVEGGEAGVKT